MIVNESDFLDHSGGSSEDFRVRLTDPMLWDRLHTLSAEYSVSIDLLVNLAVRRLVDDIEFVRDLRTGNIRGA